MSAVPSMIRGRSFLLPALILLLSSAQILPASWSTVRQVDGAKRLLTEIDGKKRAYWEVEQGKALELMITGPAELRVISRSPYRSKLKGKEYQVSWRLDGIKGGDMTHTVRKSRAARYSDTGKRLSASSSDKLEIPPGTHRLQLSVDGAPGEKLLFRMRKKFIHPIPRGGNIDLLPGNHPAIRDIVVRENVNTYQVLKSGEELELELIGPTFLKVISRLDWNSSMSGRQKYMLKVYEDGDFKNTWVLKGRQSDTAVYADKNDSVPAKGEIVYVEVPEGSHTYKIRFQDSGREVNLRFLIPRESLRNVD